MECFHIDVVVVANLEVDGISFDGIYRDLARFHVHSGTGCLRHLDVPIQHLGSAKTITLCNSGLGFGVPSSSLLAFPKESADAAVGIGILG